jgi:hypothetical protein
LGSARESGIPIRDGTSFRYESIRYWNHFVDLTTIVWLSAFMVSLLGSDLGFIIFDSSVLFLADTITLFALPIFIIDLVIKFYSFGHSKSFFKKHWISIIMVIPYFRIFKILRLVKVVGLLKFSRIPKAIKSVLNLAKMIYKVLKLKWQ